MEGAQAVYVYAVVPANESPDPASPGIGGDDAPVRLVSGPKGVAALVSDVSRDPLGAARDLRAHWRVLEQAAARGTVLPVRFGAVMESDEAVATEFLAPNAERLADLLARLEGTVELSVKLLYDEQRLLGDVVEHSPAVGRLRERVRRLPEAASYYDRIRLGELVAAEIDRLAAEDAELVLSRLEPLAVAAQAEPHGASRRAVHAAFLVRRDRIDDFSAAVRRLADEIGESARVRYVGPLPPYSFADEETVTRSPAWA